MRATSAYRASPEYSLDLQRPGGRLATSAMTPHLREGGHYVVKRFHAFFGETFQQGQRLELLKIVAHTGERYFYTEFHFRDQATGGPRVWVIDGGHADETGRDLFEAE